MKEFKKILYGVIRKWCVLCFKFLQNCIKYCFHADTFLPIALDYVKMYGNAG